MTARSYTPADRALERALLLDLLFHVVTLGATALHPWQPHAVWPAWAACALGNLLVAIAWARAGRPPRAGTVAALLAASLASLWPSAGRLAGLASSWALVETVLLVAVTEIVLRRARPPERFGRVAPWRHPGAGPLARLADVVANSRLLGVLLEPVPELTMRSDITDVVYVNYLVPATTAAAMVPKPLELQRLGPGGNWALFTFLTYRHGHFGFALLGPLRRLLPSPVQTNWRIHVVDPHTGHRGIVFLTNAITNAALALAARLTTEGMPMHVLQRGVVARDRGAIRVTLDPGTGSAPDAELALRPAAAAPALAGPWRDCFRDFRDLLEYCVPQDRAMSSQPLRGRVSRQEIDLGIPLEVCVPLEGQVVSRAARAIAGDAEPICFYVPRVRFVFSVEAHDATSVQGDDGAPPSASEGAPASPAGGGAAAAAAAQ